MKFRNPDASLFIPDDEDPDKAWSRITHLGIGAHQDDLEFMALHGILACFDRDDQWFGGVTCTRGCGSVSKESGEKLSDLRKQEQNEAARIGKYGVMAQLGYSSKEAKDTADRQLTDDLIDIFRHCRPHTVYTHNPADKHDTHIAVVLRVITAMRSLPADERPKQVLGCEVWRGLDWMIDRDKVALDVSGNPELAEQLAGVFQSQIGGGKRYDLAVRGRERANATFSESHASDASSAVWYAMDLTPLVESDELTIADLVARHIENFKQDVINQLGNSHV